MDTRCHPFGMFLVIAAEPWNFWIYHWNPIPGGPITAKLISATTIIQVYRLMTWRLSQSIFLNLSLSQTIIWYNIYSKTCFFYQTPGFLSSKITSRAAAFTSQKFFSLLPFATPPHFSLICPPVISSPKLPPCISDDIKLFKQISIWQDSVNVKYAQGFIHLSKHTSIRLAFKRSNLPPLFTFISLHV